MAKKKETGGGEEFATRQREAPNTEKLDAKLAAEAENNEPVVQASDVNTLTPSGGEDVGEAQVQARIDKETEAGLRGIEVDPTPNENYTVQGVVKGAPTPETDDDARLGVQGVRRLDGPLPL